MLIDKRFYTSLLLILVSTFAFSQKQDDIDSKHLRLFFKHVRWTCPEDSIRPKESTLLFFELHIDSAAKLVKVESWNNPLWCNFKGIKQAFYKLDKAWFEYHAGQVVIIPMLILFTGESDFGNPVKSYFDADRLRTSLRSKGTMVDCIIVSYLKEPIIN